jgi:hypothetical protein
MKGEFPSAENRVIHSHNLLDKHGLESFLVVIAFALSPFWFVEIAGVNLGIHDLILVTAAILLIFRNRSLLIFPSKATIAGVLTFLTGTGISVIISPVRFESFLNFLQYILIFLIVFPTSYFIFQEKRTRWYAYLFLISILDVLLIAVIVTAATTSVPYNQIELLYGNQNQLYWLIASGAILNYVTSLDRMHSIFSRILSLIFAILSAVFVILGLSLSAIILLSFCWWFITFWWIIHRQKGNKLYLTLFLLSTALVGLVGVVIIINNWDFFYRQANLQVRIPQYRTAFQFAVVNLPFGTGLETSEIVLESALPGERNSVHNFFIALLLEAGILGAAGMTIIFYEWIVNVFRTSILTESHLELFEFGIISIFGAYMIIVLVQPVPVRRFWWLLFAFSWVAVQSSHKHDR